MQDWNRKNPLKVKANKAKTYLKHKEKDNARCKLWRENNKEHKSQKDKEYVERNREKVLLNKRNYYLKNREKIIRNNCARTSLKRKTDYLFNLKSKLRTQIAINLIKRKYKKSKSTEVLLGANIEIVKSHIESLFKEGMNWKNHGTYGWHIDHKIPLATASNEEDIYKLFHYTNLQPLWAYENLSKGAKINN